MTNTREKRISLKHEKLVQSIRGQILSGQLKPGDPLMSESQLCETFKMSRGPVRQALTTLTRERLIYRVPGKGSFVSEGAEPRTRGEIKWLHVLMDASAGLDDNFVALEIINGFTQALSRLGGGAKLHYEFHRFKGEQDLRLDELTEGKDGLLIVPFTQYCVRFIESISQVDLPIIAMFDKVSPGVISNFFVDHEEAAFRATELLLRLGHRRIGYVADTITPMSFAGQERRKGYERAVKEAGVESRVCIAPGNHVSSSKAGGTLAQLLASEDRVTALLISGGLLTPGTLHTVRQQKLTVPDDLSIVAFDDTAEAAQNNPPLCVIKQPLVKLAEMALEQLMKEIEAPGTPTVQRGLVPDLILRDSYAPPRNPA